MASPSGPVLAVDPGRDKCGLAVVAEDGQVLHREVIPTHEAAAAVARLAAAHGVGEVIIGDRTAAQRVCRALGEAGLALQPVLVDEHRSSERARRRFFQENPPRGWRRLLPVSLQTPGRPYDDYAALLLAEEHMARRRRRAGSDQPGPEG